jgi:arginine deiminase
VLTHTHGADSEVGRLRTVLAHRPGAELLRITPRTRDRLLFAGVPWAGRAQQEHDVLAQCLRDHRVEVLYVMELLQDVMEYPSARAEAIAAVLGDPRLGTQLGADLGSHLNGLDPETLAQVLVAGLSPEEFRPGRGVVFGLLDRYDFVVPPLPNLAFLKDTSAWIGPAVAVASLADRARWREAALLRILYGHHPRFAGAACVYDPGLEPLDGGDVLQLAPGVVAVGLTDQTAPSAVERLAGRLFEAELAHAVLAVPLRQLPAGTHLDTVCTVIDTDTVLMFPALGYVLQAHVVTACAGELRVSRPMPLLESMAQAMGTEALRVISTGMDPPAASQQQWDDGGNALAIDRRLMVCYERNVETNARLEAAGVEVVRVPGSELGSGRGGPRAMACPVSRDPVVAAAQPAPAAASALAAPALTAPALAAALDGAADLVAAAPGLDAGVPDLAQAG